jgi:hypothetical protein
MEMQENLITEPAPAGRPAWRLPLILMMISLLIWFGFQTVQFVLERKSLVSATGNLREAMQESQKVRAQLEALITKTAEFARQGNPSAKRAVEELEQKGIPIQPEPRPSK